MITDIIIGIFIAILALVNTILSAINYILPTQITDAITYFFGYFGYLRGVLPIADLLLALISVMTVWGFVYFVKILFMVLNSIPFLHLNLHMPNGSEEMREHARFQELMKRSDTINRRTK